MRLIDLPISQWRTGARVKSIELTGTLQWGFMPHMKSAGPLWGIHWDNGNFSPLSLDDQVEIHYHTITVEE
jgi:hypothetical protein